jgi:septal ring factor EnvC (AmiA/AmiB activator)
MLEQFNEEVTAARKKSQRAATGSKEEITELERKLIDFDREKQSLNDAGAIKRQYDYLSEYLAAIFNIRLPNYNEIV